LTGLKSKYLTKLVFGGMLAFSNVVVGILAYAYASIDAQSYYAQSVSILLDETIDSLEANDRSLLSRLKSFRSAQSLTYENRGHLLENVRSLKVRGETTRSSSHE
jgi:hypothetical protein